MFSLIEWGLRKQHDMMVWGDGHKDERVEHPSCSPQPMDCYPPSTGKRKREDSRPDIHHLAKAAKYSSITAGPAKDDTFASVVTPQKENGKSALVTNGSGQEDRTVVVHPSDNTGTTVTTSLPTSRVKITADVRMMPVKTAEKKVGRQSAGQMAHDYDMPQWKQNIKSHFSLEILLKHRELRLIDQEIAKCQVALEQMRRCQIVPYPATTSKIEDMMAVTVGVGASRTPTTGEKIPESPTPWGIHDGPYARHYAHWLLPDPIFDGGVISDTPGRPVSGKKTVERSTRAGKMPQTVATPAKNRAQRGSTTSRLQALPAGYPEPKEEKGPMIVKRSTDGKMVKLVCLDCRRENFNSAQGFINHCRIAHGRGFASHDAAALALWRRNRAH